MSSPYLTAIICLECGADAGIDIGVRACPECGSAWLDARYDYGAVKALWPQVLAAREHTLWRYAELLPIARPDPEISMGEGYTSLIRLYQYERMYDHPHIYIKDERQGPTGSFKDRQAALAVTAMKRAGIRECVLASTGNAGAAYAAYCARAGIRLWLFLTSLVPGEKMREAALYGAEVVKVSGTYDETKDVAAEFARQKGIYLDRGARAIAGKESMKTLAFEIAEQLGLMQNPGQPRTFAAPDWYIQAVSGGIGPLGVWKGFTELYNMGLIDRIPKLGIVQAAGCAPMVQAFTQGQAKAAAVTPKTLITVLATGDPGFSYDQLYAAVKVNQGTMLAVEDGETFAAMRKLARTAGYSVEPATAVAFAGMEKMLTGGVIAPYESVVINCSGHTFPAESHVLGDQYTLNVDLAGAAATAPTSYAGLNAALENLDEQVTNILVVDDSANDRRLVRRLLQQYKQYRFTEASSGQEALAIISERRPDLIISDLTMPGMDGVTLIERLKANAYTADIPVMVLSAKTLTDHDMEVLGSYSESVWLKGGFDRYALAREVANALGHSAPASQAKESPSASSTGGKPVILLIDDNHDDLRLMHRYLDTADAYNVIDASSGRAGLKAAYEFRPDLVVLDVRMPDMNGLEVLDALRRDQQLQSIPVVLASASELENEEMSHINNQTKGIIHKTSINRRKFLDIIKSSLM